MCEFCSEISEWNNINWDKEVIIAYSKTFKNFNILIPDGPHEGTAINEVKYCPFCGEKLVWKGE